MQMRQLVLVIAFSAVAFSARAQGNEYAQERARTLYEQMEQDANCEAALPAARDFWNSSDFRALPPSMQRSLLYRIVGCAWFLEDSAAAIAAARNAQSIGAEWAGLMLIQLGLRFEDDALAVASFEAEAGRAHGRLSEVPARSVWGVLGAAERSDASGDAALRVHEALAASGYVFPEGVPDDSLRLAHARLLLARGEIVNARRRLEAVVAPREVLSMRIDRAFDPLRSDASFEARLDLEAAAEADILRARQAAGAHPRELSRVHELAQALRVLGRNEEALDELDRAISAAQASDKAYDDVADNLNWLLNEKAYTLYDLNRPEEAHDAFGLSIAAGEGGQWSVSQVINFASMLESEGKPADALEVLRTVGQASPYGDMWVASVRACAAEQLADQALQDESMAFLRAHGEDNVSALAAGLICINALDEAAALYIRRLSDPEEREGALTALQIYRRMDRPALAWRDQRLERLDQIRQRADVRAAVDLVGRIEETPLYATYWGDV